MEMGKITSMVSGSSLYRIVIQIRPLAARAGRSSNNSAAPGSAQWWNSCRAGSRKV